MSGCSALFSFFYTSLDSAASKLKEHILGTCTNYKLFITIYCVYFKSKFVAKYKQVYRTIHIVASAGIS